MLVYKIKPYFDLWEEELLKIHNIFKEAVNDIKSFCEVNNISYIKNIHLKWYIMEKSHIIV